MDGAEHTEKKKEKMLGTYNYEYIKKKRKMHHAIFSEQVTELHRVIEVQKMLTERVLKEKPEKRPEPSQSPSSSKVPTHDRYRQLDAYGMDQLPPAPTIKTIPNLYAQMLMDGQQIQVPPLPILLYTPNPHLQNSGDYLSTSSSGVIMRPSLGFEAPRPANKDSEPSHSSSSTKVYNHLDTGHNPVDMQQLYAYHMNNTNLPLPAQSNSVYNFAVQNPREYLSTSSSGVTMRPPMGLEFQIPANKDSKPSQSPSSGQVSTHRMNMQKLFYYHTDKMKVPLPAQSTSGDDFAIQYPRDYRNTCTSEVAMMPPMGFDFGRSAYAEDQGGSSSVVNPNSYKMSTDGSNKDCEVDLSLSIAAGDSKGMKKLESLEPLPSQQSSFSDPAHDLTRRPDISASLNSDQGDKSRDLTAAMGGSSRETIHQETQETKWLFRD